MTIRGQTPEGQEDKLIAGFPIPITHEQKSVLHKMIRIEVARECAKVGDVLGWGQALMPEKFNLPFCELHRFLVDHRKDELFALEAARGHAKTTCACMLIPLYQALNEPEEFVHYLQIQATDDKAMSVNTTIKVELEKNELIKACYGNQCGTDRWTNGQFVLKNGVCFTAVGAGQSIRGINYRNRRPDYLMIDDLYNEDDLYSMESTEKKTAWMWSTVYPARAKSRKSSIRITGTPANKEDILEKLKTAEGWTHGTFPAAKNIDTGPALWPELNSLEKLQRDSRSMPIVIFLRELMCERRDDSESIVKSEWLANWEYDPVNLKFDESMQYVGGILGIDPSIGKKETSDYTGYAFVLKGQPTDGSLPLYYIEALANEHLSFQERLDKAKEMISNRPRERPATKVFVEGISGFEDFADRVAASVSIPCEVIKRVPDKILHLEKKSHYFQNKRIFISNRIAPDLRKLIEYQLTTNNPKNDDVRDALLHALEDESASWASFMS